LTALGEFEPGWSTSASAINADGTVIAAEAGQLGSGPPTLLRGEVAGNSVNYTPLFVVDGIQAAGSIQGISADGSTLVGEAGFDGSFLKEAVRQVDGGFVESLGLPGVARAASADGSVIVGQGQLGEFDFGAFVWTEASGAVSIYDLLVDNGVDLSDFVRISDAVAITPDGRYVAGRIRGSAFGEGAVLIELPAVIPEPTTLLAITTTIGVVLRRRRS
jgi:uncharacterized membrane protein